MRCRTALSEGYDLSTWVHDRDRRGRSGSRAVLLSGVSRGGPVAIAFAAQHPEQVTHLVLYGTFLREAPGAGATPEDLAEADVQVQLAHLGWGSDIPAFRQVFAPSSSRMAPASCGTNSTSSSDARPPPTSQRTIWRHRASSTRLIRPLVRAQPSCSTLAVTAGPLSRRGGARLRSSPDNRFVTLEGDNHILLEDEPAWPQFVDEVRTIPHE